MKSLLSFSTFIFCRAVCHVGSAQRLPELASPENYQLTLTPNFADR